MIDILVPVRERPQNVVPVMASAKANTVVPYRMTFLVHPDDREELNALFKAGARYIRSPEHSYPYKINLGASLSTCEFFFLGADDVRFHPGWDTSAIDRYHETGCAVIGTRDLGNPTVERGRHSTHTLIHRSYLSQGTIDEPGKLLHEGYAHQWCDTEMISTAQKRGQWTFCRESVVEHLHPFWHKGPMDHVYEIGLSTSAEDMRLFQQRRHLWR